MSAEFGILTVEVTFEKVWKLYDKKTDKKICEKLWGKISDEDKNKIIVHVPAYVKATPDKYYRKNFKTYLRNECWNDEIVAQPGVVKTTDKLKGEIRIMPTNDFKERELKVGDVYRMQSLSHDIMIIGIDAGREVELKRMTDNKIYKIPFSNFTNSYYFYKSSYEYRNS